MNTRELKVLMISSDRNILVSGSAVSERMKEYGALVEELHIVLLSDSSYKLKDVQLSPNVWVYPTNSSFKFSRPLDAVRIGKKVVFEKKFVRGKGVITAQDPFECGWAAMKIKRKWRLPLEIQLHTDPFSPYFSGFQNKVRKFFARTVLAKADSVRAVSENLKSRILNLKSNADISVLPIYVDKEKIENAPIKFDLHARYPWRFIVLTVARLAPEKNLNLAMRALALARQKFPDIGLVVVGNGSEESHLKSLVKKLKLEGAVEFAGWQDNLTSFYKTANVFIQTSLFEGYGLSLVEAGLSGLPVVTTPVGIALELEHGKDAYIYPLDSARDKPAELFADGIVELIESNQKRENLKMNLKRTLESKLLSKEEYLTHLKVNWEETAKKVKV
ncbi:MAG: glycosyltransferase [Candidatus Zambryskibacteria bacterium]|nr:glycosyltransferase [Candidatus Zambryskibacteria bacterium]